MNLQDWLRKNWVVPVVVVVVAAVAVATQSGGGGGSGPPASTTTTSSSPSTSTSTTEAATTTTTAGSDLPFRTEAGGVFRMKTTDLKLDPRSDEWVERMLTYGAGDSDRSRANFGGIEFGGDPNNNYGIPTYYTTDATMQVKVRRKDPSAWPGVFNIGPDETVPWNPNWRPSDGNDGFLHVLDPVTGHAWGFWNVSWWSYWTGQNHNAPCYANGQNLPPLWLFGQNFGGVGFDPTSQLCAASAFQVRDPHGAPVDIRSWTGNTPGASGGGWFVLPVTPDEVASGDIGHALHMLAMNTMGGPLCTSAQREDPNALGNDCGDAVSPAGQMESGAAPGHFPIDKSVPEGMRFGLKMTDEQVQEFLDSKGYEGAKRRTAEVLINALRDYGWFLGDTTNGGAIFSAASIENPADREKWKVLGIDHTDADGLDRGLLYGIFTKDTVVAYEPSKSLCADRVTISRWYCAAWSTGY